MSPESDANQQFEMVGETSEPQPEILAGSSISGSSFVNVPSCGEVESYQDISTSASPDSSPSSPNRTPNEPPVVTSSSQSASPTKPGFIFTVNPSIVPGSIIRTPDRPSSKPHASLYEDTVVGTAEI